MIQPDTAAVEGEGRVPPYPCTRPFRNLIAAHVIETRDEFICAASTEPEVAMVPKTVAISVRAKDHFGVDIFAINRNKSFGHAKQGGC